MNKTIKDRLEGYKHYERENLDLAMAETEELMEQIAKAVTVTQAQELARAWLIVWRSGQMAEVPPSTSETL